MLPPVEESVPPDGAYRSDEVIPRTEDASLARRPPPRWSRAEIIAIVAITLIAAIIRLVHLADPPEYVFDEVYYAKDACIFAEEDPELCGIPGESTEVHPPLGKAIISLGVAAFGFDSFGWRIMSALAGSLSVALLFLIARRLFSSLVAASAAALLLALDFLHFVQSRVAMLDIFLVLFGLLAFYFLLLDRAALMRRLDEVGSARRNRLLRPWRAAAGIAAGAATACKWSGAFILIAIVLISIAWEKAARREAGEPSSLGRVLASESFSIFLWLMLLPVIVYAASYAGHLEGQVFAAPWEPGSWLRNVWERQQYMWDFHKDLTAMHSYQSPSWSWLAIKRPVSYFFCSGAEGATACHPPTAEGNYEEIVALGNPFVWWSSLVAMLYLGVAWVRSRDWRRPEGFILAGFLLTYLPWLIPASDRSALFIFYLLPSVPFMCLALAYAAARLGRSWEARTAIAVFATATIALFAFYYPVMTKGSLPKPEWEQRMTPHFRIFDREITLFADCVKPPGETVQVTSTITRRGGETVSTSPSTKDYEGPPDGWCWI
ncbi:MAG: dolichyl-phosphate-mannose-protein mannosyltransferase [Actinomycetota bacterium]|nr:dolichyl-phosphate-mannose-protein mannosyltransferase [Actinomycetota bacterium]